MRTRIDQWNVAGGDRSLSEKALAAVLARDWREFWKHVGSRVLYTEGRPYAMLDVPQRRWIVLGPLPYRSLEASARHYRKLVCEQELCELTVCSARGHMTEVVSMLIDDAHTISAESFLR